MTDLYRTLTEFGNIIEKYKAQIKEKEAGKEWVSCSEAAKIKNVTPATVRRWAKQHSKKLRSKNGANNVKMVKVADLSSFPNGKPKRLV